MSDVQEFDQKLTGYIVGEATRLKSFYQSELENETDESRKESLKRLISSSDGAIENIDEAKRIMVAFSARTIVDRIMETDGQIKRKTDGAYIQDSGVEGMVFSQAEKVIEKYSETPDHLNLLKYGITEDQLVQEIYEACGFDEVLPTRRGIETKEAEVARESEDGRPAEEIAEKNEEIEAAKIALGLDPKAPVKERKQNIQGIPTVYRADKRTISINDLTRSALGSSMIGTTQVKATEAQELTNGDLENGDISLDN